jgi:hypothetical protein
MCSNSTSSLVLVGDTARCGCVGEVSLRHGVHAGIVKEAKVAARDYDRGLDTLNKVIQ